MTQSIAQRVHELSFEFGFEFAKVSLSRHKAELRLMAAIAGSPRQALPILTRRRFKHDDIANLDAAAIATVLIEASSPIGPPMDVQAAMLKVKRLLQGIDRWNDSNVSPILRYGESLGPGDLIAIFTAVPFAVETLIEAHENLIAIDRQQAAMIPRERSGK